MDRENGVRLVAGASYTAVGRIVAKKGKNVVPKS